MPTATSKLAEENIYEEIQLLVQENELLLAAAMEQLKPTAAVTKIAGQRIFLDNGEKKTSSANLYLSRASELFGKTLRSRELHDFSSPPLALASTFDSESPSDESYASPRSLFGSDHVLSLQGADHFPLLSVPDIAAMMEEQQQRRSEDKKAQVDKEQAQIDEGLKRLHMELEYTDSIPEIFNDDDNDDDTIPGPYPPVRKTIQFWDEAEKASSLPSPPQQPKKTLVVSNTTTGSPPPSPVRKSIQLWEAKCHTALLSPSSNSSSTLSQPATGRLDVSKLLVFDSHPKEHAAGPTDLDEADDDYEQKSKDKGIGIDTITIPSLSISTSVSSSSESEVLVSSDPDLHEEFSRLKATMLVGILCILGVIGMIGFAFGSSRDRKSVV